MRRALWLLLLALPAPALGQRSDGARAGVAIGAEFGDASARWSAPSFAHARQGVRDESDPWFGPDKVRHFFVSAALQSIAYGTLRAADMEHRAALATASAVTAVVGVGKEVSDRRKGRLFSARDLLWDAAGAAAISVLLAQTER